MTRKATVDDFKHSRDEEGELTPVTKTVELPGDEEVEVKVIPLTQGHINRYESDLDGDFDEMDNQAMRTVMEEHFRQPDFRNDDGEVPMDVVEDIKPAMLEPLMKALLETSGLDDVEGEAGDLVGEGNPS